MPGSISATPVEGPIDVEEGIPIDLPLAQFDVICCCCRAGEHHGAGQHIGHPGRRPLDVEEGKPINVPC